MAKKEKVKHINNKDILKNEDEEKSVILTLDNDECGVYDIHIKTYYYKGTGDNIKGGALEGGLGMRANKIGLETLFKLFAAIREDMHYMDHIGNMPKDIFHRTRNFLSSEYNSKVRKGNNFMEMIEKDIKNLMEYKFVIGYPGSRLEDREVSLEDIKNMFARLREHHINFYKAVLEEYKKKKEEYDKSLGWDLL